MENDNENTLRALVTFLVLVVIAALVFSGVIAGISSALEGMVRTQSCVPIEDYTPGDRPGCVVIQLEPSK